MAESLCKTKGTFQDHFRGLEGVEDFVIRGELSKESGYFGLGPDVTCYGQCSSGQPAKFPGNTLHDVRKGMRVNGSEGDFPFDPVKVLDNLLCERYLGRPDVSLPGNSFTRNLYYFMRPYMPIPLRKHVQRLYLHRRLRSAFPRWPVDRSVENICERVLVHLMHARKIDRMPFIWFWPDGAQSCTIMTHDVETENGLQFCSRLMDLNDSFQIKSSFQVVPEGRYRVPRSFVEEMRSRGFEVNIHDFNHDGHLLRDHEQFLRRAEKINEYARTYGALGFRSAILYRNADWYDALNFSFDMSIPNVAHLDPQRGGCCTVLPFFIGNVLELPVTMTQDYTLFYILDSYSIDLWKQQCELVREKYGLASFIIHPDYVIGRHTRAVYSELLAYLSRCRSQRQTWIALPGQAASWWRQRSRMSVTGVDGRWRIVGEGSERASLAYAVLTGDKVSYELDGRTLPAPIPTDTAVPAAPVV